MLPTLRDPWLGEQLAMAVELASEGRAAELGRLVDELRRRSVPLTADDEVLLGTSLGAAFANSHKYKAAQQALDAVQPLLTAVRTRRQARFLAISARTAQGRGNGDIALDLAVRAVSLVNNDGGLPDDEDVAVTLGNCTIVFAMLELFPLAVQTGERAITAGITAGSPVGRWHFHLGFVHMCRAVRQSHVGMSAEARVERVHAIERMEQALGCIDLPDLIRCWAAAWLASCAARHGLLDLARDSLQLARDVVVDPPNWSATHAISQAYAHVLQAEGRLDQARLEMLALWKVVVKARAALWCEEVAWTLGQLAEGQGDYAEALRWYREMHKRYGRTQYEAWRSRGTAARLKVEQQALIRRTNQLEYDVLSDPLTGVANRRSFDAQLPRLVTSAHGNGTPFTLAILDIDHFKQINDVYGHPAGDEVLRQIARIVQEQCRGSDRCARYGGDELVVCLPARLPEATSAVTRIAQRVAEHPWSTVSPGLSVTVSSGLAQLGPGDTATTLFWAADQSLLTAKQARKAARGADYDGMPIRRAASG